MLDLIKDIFYDMNRYITGMSKYIYINIIYINILYILYMYPLYPIYKYIFIYVMILQIMILRLLSYFSLSSFCRKRMVYVHEIRFSFFIFEFKNEWPFG